jgi:hypothetical protein
MGYKPKNFALVVVGRVEAELRDRDGRLILKRSFPMRSFVKNFLEILRGLFASYVTVTSGGVLASVADFSTINIADIIDVSGTSQTLQIKSGTRSTNSSVDMGLLALNAPAGDSSWGLLVGRGTTSPTPNDFALEDPYSEGTGAGQLSHGASSVEATSVSGNQVTTRIIRTFTNNYTGSQNVSEVGLVARWKYYYYGVGLLNQDVKFLIARDVLPAPISVGSGQTLTMRYVITIQT